MQYEEKLSRNADVATDIIHQYLIGKIDGSDKVKIASLAITQFCKHEATKGANGALQFAICRSISHDQDELKQMISGTMPDKLPAKKLPR